MPSYLYQGAVVASGFAVLGAYDRLATIEALVHAASETRRIHERVLDHLRERAHACLKAGIQSHKIVLDPGIGFGKTLEHNLALMRHLPALRSLGLPLLLGVSRKSFIAQITESAGAQAASGPKERIGGTIAAVLRCIEGGASVLRVHDVAEVREAMLVHRSLYPERL